MSMNINIVFFIIQPNSYTVILFKKRMLTVCVYWYMNRNASKLPEKPFCYCLYIQKYTRKNKLLLVNLANIIFQIVSKYKMGTHVAACNILSVSCKFICSYK